MSATRGIGHDMFLSYQHSWSQGSKPEHDWKQQVCAIWSETLITSKLETGYLDRHGYVIIMIYSFIYLHDDRRSPYRPIPAPSEIWDHSSPCRWPAQSNFPGPSPNRPAPHIAGWPPELFAASPRSPVQIIIPAIPRQKQKTRRFSEKTYRNIWL